MLCIPHRSCAFTSTQPVYSFKANQNLFTSKFKFFLSNSLHSLNKQPMFSYLICSSLTFVMRAFPYHLICLFILKSTHVRCSNTQTTLIKGKEGTNTHTLQNVIKVTTNNSRLICFSFPGNDFSLFPFSCQK